MTIAATEVEVDTEEDTFFGTAEIGKNNIWLVDIYITSRKRGQVQMKTGAEVNAISEAVFHTLRKAKF